MGILRIRLRELDLLRLACKRSCWPPLQWSARLSSCGLASLELPLLWLNSTAVRAMLGELHREARRRLLLLRPKLPMSMLNPAVILSKISNLHQSCCWFASSQLWLNKLVTRVEVLINIPTRFVFILVSSIRQSFLNFQIFTKVEVLIYVPTGLDFILVSSIRRRTCGITSKRMVSCRGIEHHCSPHFLSHDKTLFPHTKCECTSSQMEIFFLGYYLFSMFIIPENPNSCYETCSKIFISGLKSTQILCILHTISEKKETTTHNTKHKKISRHCPLPTKINSTLI